MSTPNRSNLNNIVYYDKIIGSIIDSEQRERITLIITIQAPVLFIFLLCSFEQIPIGASWSKRSKIKYNSQISILVTLNGEIA